MSKNIRIVHASFRIDCDLLENQKQWLAKQQNGGIADITIDGIL